MQATVCRATYGPGNTGRTILVQVVLSRQIQARQASSFYLSADGETESNCTTTSLFTIENGRLLGENRYYSAPRNVSSIVFSASDGIDDISTIFGVTDDTMFWDDPSFEGGTARFCIYADGTIYAIFQGNLPESCSPILLKTRQLFTCPGRAQLSGSSSAPLIAPSTTSLASGRGSVRTPVRSPSSPFESGSLATSRIFNPVSSPGQISTSPFPFAGLSTEQFSIPDLSSATATSEFSTPASTLPSRSTVTSGPLDEDVPPTSSRSAGSSFASSPLSLPNDDGSSSTSSTRVVIPSSNSALPPGEESTSASIAGLSSPSYLSPSSPVSRPIPSTTPNTSTRPTTSEAQSADGSYFEPYSSFTMPNSESAAPPQQSGTFSSSDFVPLQSLPSLSSSFLDHIELPSNSTTGSNDIVAPSAISDLRSLTPDVTPTVDSGSTLTPSLSRRDEPTTSAESASSASSSPLLTTGLDVDTSEPALSVILNTLSSLQPTSSHSGKPTEEQSTTLPDTSQVDESTLTPISISSTPAPTSITGPDETSTHYTELSSPATSTALVSSKSEVTPVPSDLVFSLSTSDIAESTVYTFSSASAFSELSFSSPSYIDEPSTLFNPTSYGIAESSLNSSGATDRLSSSFTDNSPSKAPTSDFSLNVPSSSVSTEESTSVAISLLEATDESGLSHSGIFSPTTSSFLDTSQVPFDSDLTISLTPSTAETDPFTSISSSAADTSDTSILPTVEETSFVEQTPLASSDFITSLLVETATSSGPSPSETNEEPLTESSELSSTTYTTSDLLTEPSVTSSLDSTSQEYPSSTENLFLMETLSSSESNDGSMMTTSNGLYSEFDSSTAESSLLEPSLSDTSTTEPTSSELTASTGRTEAYTTFDSDTLTQPVTTAERTEVSSDSSINMVSTLDLESIASSTDSSSPIETSTISASSSFTEASTIFYEGNPSLSSSHNTPLSEKTSFTSESLSSTPDESSTTTTAEFEASSVSAPSTLISSSESTLSSTPTTDTISSSSILTSMTETTLSSTPVTDTVTFLSSISTDWRSALSISPSTSLPPTSSSATSSLASTHSTITSSSLLTSSTMWTSSPLLYESSSTASPSSSSISSGSATASISTSTTTSLSNALSSSSWTSLIPTSTTIYTPSVFTTQSSTSLAASASSSSTLSTMSSTLSASSIVSTGSSSASASTSFVVSSYSTSSVTSSLWSTSSTSSSVSSYSASSTMTGPLSTSSTSSTITSLSSSLPSTSSSKLGPVQQASLIIARNGSSYLSFCSDFLGYSDLRTTAYYSAYVSASTTVTTLVGISTRSSRVTLVVTRTAPATTLTQTFTPTVTTDLTETVIVSTTTARFVTVTRQQRKRDAVITSMPGPGDKQIEKRQNANTASIPQSLTSFPIDVISSACSLNVILPSQPPTVTRTTLSTVVSTLYQTQPSSYRDETATVFNEVTIKDGTVSTTVTGGAYTQRNMYTTLTTTMKTETSACVAFATPSVYLSSPTAIVGSPNGATANYDDFSYKLTTPFALKLYGYSSSTIWVSTNGVLSFDNPPGCTLANNAGYSANYVNFALPSKAWTPIACQITTNTIPGYSAFPFWDDTYVFSGQPQGIYYQVEGTKITFEYYLSHYNDAPQYYHYLLIYDTTQPGNFTFKYLQIKDNGVSATVGVQGNNINFLQWSYNETKVVAGLQLTFDTTKNIISSLVQRSSC